ncbi:hypothetical protein PVL29_025729 [Vitis rotundifolia]|uniref:Cytochrome P450 714C2 n=1 Tax=Vitis rotundifolia TaxID=103349 RepID=A0AA38YKM9_VITRO|nr:hypothetical protein PVL29_025729 [Vitis rotundifolia]
MEEVYSSSQMLMTCLSAFLIGLWGILFVRVFNDILVKPNAIRWKLRRQGIRGPPPSFVTGNIPEMGRIMSMAKAPSSESPPPLDFSSPRIFPYFSKWTKQYGSTFTFALGDVQLLYVADPKLVKEMGKSVELGKPPYLQKERGPLLGKGILTTDGAVWSHQRKTIAPQLYMDKAKARVEIMLESANKLVRSWESLMENGGGSADIRVLDENVRGYTSSVISSAIFGSNNSKGVELFPKFRALMTVMHSSTLLKGVSIHRHDNRYAWGLDKEITSCILDMAKEHSDAVSKELPQVIINTWLITADVYQPGFEVTAVASMWGLMLLASHPEWQDRIRAEVAQVCAGRPLAANMLGKMKVLKMVIQEVLRLYSGVVILTKPTLKDVQLGDVSVPEGAKEEVCWVWLPALHQDSEFRGPDATKFKPKRFANGLSRACNPSIAYVSFAIAEIKVLYAHILSNFSLSQSPIIIDTCETKVWLISILMITKQCLELMIIFQV